MTPTPITPDDALARLQALSDPIKAEHAAAYHKTPRPYLGITVPDITALATEWRAHLDTAERVAVVDHLWRTNIHEARVAAAKLLTQARIADDTATWDLIASWVTGFDAWAIADHACDAGNRRLIADPNRLDQVEPWITHANVWTRRAALVMTLPWTKQNFPKPHDLQIRDRVLGWAATMITDKDWFIQKAIAWWLRDLSRHDPQRAHDFLDGPGQGMKPWARKEAAKHL